MTDLFDAASTYDEDYLYFFAAHDRSELATHGLVIPGAESSGEAAAGLTWRLLDLRPGMSVRGWLLASSRPKIVRHREPSDDWCTNGPL